jgi:uncharacterized protein (DUF302 family)
LTVRRRLPGAVACVLLILLAPPLHAQMPQVYQREARKPLADVLDDIEFAVTERNFRITGTLHVGRGIRERHETNFPDYEVILFCNLEYAKQMLELNPSLINLCPGRITVRDSGNSVIIAAPLLPEDSGNARADRLLRKVNRLVREIVDYGAENWSPPVP